MTARADAARPLIAPAGDGPASLAEAARRSLSDRESARVATAIVLAGVGAMFSAKLAGRLAISNIPQAISLAMLLGGVRRLLRPVDIAFIGFTLVGLLAAYMSVLRDYNYLSSPVYAAFFLISGTWLTAVYRCCQRAGGVAAVLRGLQRTLPITFVIFAIRAAMGIARGSIGNLGFDDKSHAAVYAVCLALIAVEVLSGRGQFFMAIGFTAIAMATRSRLPYLFLPPLVFGLLHSYRFLRTRARSGLSAFVAQLGMAALIAAPIIAATIFRHYFVSFYRAFQPTNTARQSTASHLLLIEHGAQLKVDSLANFLFGITPRGFAGVLYRSSHDLSRIASTDPGAYNQIVAGTAPMHSSIGSIVVEFPIWVALLFVGLIISLTKMFVRARAWVPLTFLLSLVLSTSFYSSHTEVFFYIVLAAIIATAFDHRSEPHAGDRR